MKVTIIIGANAYACIKTSTVSHDVLLSPGKSAAASMAETVREMRAKADYLQSRAALIEQAIQHL